MTKELDTLAAEFAQLRTELGAWGVNMTPNAKAQLDVVAARIAAMLPATTQQSAPKSAGKSKPE